MKEKKRLVVLSGSGMSRESGLRTFREMGGLWEEYDVQEVASPEGWARDRALVLRFYNERRKQLQDAIPNRGHEILAAMEAEYRVQIITQNVDDLHERAGSTEVLHLHGELKKARSTGDPSLVYDMKGWELKEGDLCEKGFQLRPHIVWFGEAVPAIEPAAQLVSAAEILVIIGTSLNVYPAAGLIAYAPAGIPVYLIDPNEVNVPYRMPVQFLQMQAGEGLEELQKRLGDDSKHKV